MGDPSEEVWFVMRESIVFLTTVSREEEVNSAGNDLNVSFSSKLGRSGLISTATAVFGVNVETM